MTEQMPTVPRWRRIAQTLALEIDAEGLEPGARLPTEAALATRFGVNRHTVRRAVETLVRQGRVRVEQGRGAFVAEDVLAYEISARTRFSEWVRRKNRSPEGQVLHLRALEATRTVATGLRVRPGAPVVTMGRLGLADRVPVTLSDHYFSVDRLPGIEAALHDAPNISAALAQVGVPDYIRQSTRVGARMPTAAEAELLRITRTRPLLVCENINVDPAGTIIEYGITRHPSTRVEVVFEP